MTLRDIAIALGFDVDESQAKKAEDRIKGIKNMAVKLLGAIGIGFSIVQLNALAEEFNGINDQIRQATQGMGEQEDIQQQILKTANEIRMGYGDTANMISRLTQEDKNLFGSVDEAAEFVELSTKLFKSANKSEQEIVALQDSINKSFAKGIVDTETINQLYEKAPEAIDLIADSLGVAKRDLAKMVTDGQIQLGDLKNAFVQNADVINAKFGSLDLSISDALLNIRNQWGLWLDDVNSGVGITKTIAEGMVRGFTAFMNTVKKAQIQVERLTNRVGGLPNLLKLIAMAAAAIFISLNAGKIVAFAKSVPGFLSKVGGLLKGINLKVFALMAVLMLLFLAVDDFIHFMKGDNSVIGSLLEKAGVDTQKVRDTIIGAWSAIRAFLGSVWGKIKGVAEKVWGGLADFWAENGAEIKDALLAVWTAIVSVLQALWVAVKSVATSVFNALQQFWASWGDKIMAAFSILWETCGKQVMLFFDVLKNLGEFISNIFSGDWAAAWENIKNILWGILQGIVNAITGIFEIIWTFIGDKVIAIRDTIVNAFTAVRDKVVEIFTSVKDTVKSVFDALVDIVKAPINGIIDLLNMLIGGLNKLRFTIPDWIPGIGGSQFGFNIPSIPRLAQGGYLKANSPRLAVVGDNPTQGEIVAPEGKILSVVLDALEIFATRLRPGQSVSTVGATTSSRTITQNVHIENTFTGGPAEAQKQGAKAMDKAAADTTGELARALAYGR